MGKEFSTIEEAIEDVRQGKMIVIVDDEDRENEGDLMIAAEKVTPELINFMARFGRGLICLTLTEKRTRELELSMMVDDNQFLKHPLRYPLMRVTESARVSQLPTGHIRLK